MSSYTTKNSPYDTYMDKATEIYNQKVEENNKAAANQAASAGAQYREVNRNIGELNKANGRANTGYAGDTSIDAYNAYRNSVNESYANADKTNNELYSYYINEMLQLQQAKDSKEYNDRQLEQTDRQLGLQEEQFEYDKTVTDRQLEQTDRELKMDEEQFEHNKVYGEGGFKEQIESSMTDNDFYSDGTIKAETAEKWWNFAISYFGGEDKIPSTAKGSMESVPGFSEWLAEYNNQSKTTGEYIAKHNVTKPYSLQKVNNSGEISEDGTIDFAVLNTVKNTGSSKICDLRLDNFRLDYNGETYYLETGNTNKSKPAKALVELMKEQIKTTTGRDPVEGDCCYYNGNIYICCDNGNFRKVEEREASEHADGYNNFVSSVKNILGLNND